MAELRMPLRGLHKRKLQTDPQTPCLAGFLTKCAHCSPNIYKAKIYALRKVVGFSCADAACFFLKKLLRMVETKCLKLKYENGKSSPQNEFITVLQTVK